MGQGCGYDRRSRLRQLRPPGLVGGHLSAPAERVIMSEVVREPMSYAEADHRLTEMAERIRGEEKTLRQATAEAADAESVYRRALAERLDYWREQGLAVEHAQTKAK